MESDVKFKGCANFLESDMSNEDSSSFLQNRVKLEDDKKEQEDEQSDYEYSLRIENIRLKSKLEQVKEKVLSLEKSNELLLQKYENEKSNSKKANNKVFMLMQENQTLGDNLKRMKSNEGLHGIISKMEKEIYHLKDRLENQQKYYQKEQQSLYDNLSEKRKVIEQWKQTYFKSQVAVMSFRRKIKHVQQYLTFDQHQKLSQCLEVMDDAYISKNDDVKYPKNLSNGSVSKLYKTYVDDTNANISSEIFSGSLAITTNGNKVIDRKISAQTAGRFDETKDSQPTVFIMDEENSLIEPHSQQQRSSLKEQSIPVNHINLNSSKGSILTNSVLVAKQPQSSELTSNTLQPSSMIKQDYNQQKQPFNDHPSLLHYPTSNDNQKDRTFASPDLNNEFKPSKIYSNNSSYKNSSNYLELKFDSGFMKSPSKSFTNYTKDNFSKPESHNHSSSSSSSRSHAVIAGTPLPRNRIWCLKCDSEVTDKGCEHSAELVVQEREKEFPCPACGRIFNNRSHLKRHHMIHSGEKPWSCPHCEKRFNRKSHLNRHLLTHTGEKPFKCPVCQKGFADNSDLKRHRQTHEFTMGPLVTVNNPAVTDTATSSTNTSITGYMSLKKAEPRFPCNICGKYFSRKSHLTRHKLTHDQQKIYCNCGRMFRQQAHLNAHLPSCKRKRELIEAKYKADHPEEFMHDQHTPEVFMHDQHTPASMATNENISGGVNETSETIISQVKQEINMDVDNSDSNNAPFFEGREMSHEELTPTETPVIDEKGEHERSMLPQSLISNISDENSKEIDLNFNTSAVLANLPPLIKDPII